MEKVAAELRHAAAGADVAYHASNAIYALQIEFRKPAVLRPSLPQRDEILQALGAARPHIVSLFTTSADSALVLKGLDGVAGLVQLWTAPDAERAATRRHARADMDAYARWLRNACHNLSLLDEIAERAESRRRVAVGDLKRLARNMA